MQVDGEACRVRPSIIEIELLNKAVMLAKRKHGRGDVQLVLIVEQIYFILYYPLFPSSYCRVNPLEKLQLSILKVSMEQYQKHHHDTEMLRNSAQKLGVVEIESQFDLEQVRNMLKSRFADMICYSRLSNDWCFIDCKIYRYPITSPILLQTNIV